jgi:glutamate racemase
MPIDRRPIAVFDSGLGGLTVASALRRRMPFEDIVYFGDTARIPYGTKTPDTVMRFAREDCAFLLRMNPKCIVAACNTASAVCLPRLADELPVPIVGVVEPGAHEAVLSVDGNGVVGVIATESTIASNAYKNAIFSLQPRCAVVQVACPLLVPIVEEGLDTVDPIVGPVIERYLGPMRRLSPSVVVLGCTHYPILRDALSRYFGDEVRLIDSGSAAAESVERMLSSADGFADRRHVGELHCYVSDHPRRFQQVGSRFLGETIFDTVRVCPEELALAGATLKQSIPRVSA